MNLWFTFESACSIKASLGSHLLLYLDPTNFDPYRCPSLTLINKYHEIPWDGKVSHCIQRQTKNSDNHILDVGSSSRAQLSLPVGILIRWHNHGVSWPFIQDDFEPKKFKNTYMEQKRKTMICYFSAHLKKCLSKSAGIKYHFVKKSRTKDWF